MLLSESGMPYVSESSLQKSCSRCSMKILCRLKLREVESQVSIRMAQSCVRTPISVKKPNNSRLLPSERHGNMSRCSSEFEKFLAFLRRHRVGRQLAPVQTAGQHCLDAEIIDKEIVCILSAFVKTTR
jgi:hypothetical protein